MPVRASSLPFRKRSDSCSLIRGQVETLSAIESVANLMVPATPSLPRLTDGRATAFLQYTSGSTGDPKGVVLSHANLLANIRAMGTAIEASSADIFVSWLPLYHDFGLIGAWLGSLYFAASFYVMSPLSFLARPESWLRAIHRYRATLSAAPNFGFELCVGQNRGRRHRGRRSQFAASRGERRRAGQRTDAAQVHQAISAVWLQAGGDDAGLWPRRERRRPHAFAARPRAADRPRQP